MHPGLLRVLARNGLERPDGRRLYEYGVQDDELTLLRNSVRRAAERSGWGALVQPYIAPIFVLGASETVCRARELALWKWGPICAALGLDYPPPTHSTLANGVSTGLEWWGRSVFQGEHAQEYLKSIIFESGIPAAAVGGWLGDWVASATRLVRLGHPPEVAAQSGGRNVHVQGAELLAPAVAVLSDRLAQALSSLPALEERRGIDPIAWLDARRPDWRTGLGFALAPATVDGFVRTVIGAVVDRRGVGGRVAATRILVRRPDGWLPCVQLDLDGPVPGHWNLAAQLSGLSRARLMPAGDLLLATQSALAVLALSADEDGPAAWRLQPLQRAPLPLALDAPVLGALGPDGLLAETVVLASGLEPGAAIHVFVEADEDAGTLRHAASGPCRLADDSAVVAVASDPAAALRGMDGIEEIGSIPSEGLSLFRLRETLDLERIGLTGGRIRLRDPEAPPTVSLRPTGPLLGGVRGCVFREVSAVFAERDGVLRHLPRNDLRWRPVGSREWRPWCGGPLGVGPVGDVVLACAGEDGGVSGGIRVTVAGPGLHIYARSGCLEIRSDLAVAIGPGAIAGETVVVPLPDAPGATVPVRLTYADGTELRLEVEDPRTDQAFTDPSGRILANVASLPLGALHGWSAVSRSGRRLTIGLVGGDNRRILDTQAEVRGVQPVIGLAPTLRSLLGSVGDQDAHVRIEWLGVGGGTLRVRLFDAELRPDGEGVVVPDGLAGRVRLKAIPLLAPDRAELLYEGPADGCPHRIQPAGSVGGPWFFWGTADGVPRIRPCVAYSVAPRPAGWSEALAEAVDAHPRDLRLARFIALARDPSSRPELLRFVRALLGATAGEVPPAAFDPLMALVQEPDAFVDLLAEAFGTAEIDAVLDLDADLPIVWQATSIDLWQRAFERRASALIREMTALGLSELLARQALRVQYDQLMLKRSALRVHAALASGDPVLLTAAMTGPFATADELRIELVQMDAAQGFPGLFPPSAFAAPLDEAWHGIATAPRIAAELATGARQADPETLSWTWRAQAVAPSWFERAVLVEILALAHS
jgi:hypothetical protein